MLPKISELAEKISDRLKKAEWDNVSKLEIDLLQQHLRDLYDNLEMLRDAGVVIKPGNNGVSSSGDETPEREVQINKPRFNANQHLLMGNEQPEIKARPKAEEPVVKPVINLAVEGLPEINPVKTKTQSLNDVTRPNGSLNEKLKAGGGEVHQKLSTKPLKDLIDLNKKFVLLNELFKGNSEAYTGAIAHIDSLNAFSEAEDFIKTQLVNNYYWDETAQTVRMFMKLVKQRFGEV